MDCYAGHHALSRMELPRREWRATMPPRSALPIFTQKAVSGGAAPVGRHQTSSAPLFQSVPPSIIATIVKREGNANHDESSDDDMPPMPQQHGPPAPVIRRRVIPQSTKPHERSTYRQLGQLQLRTGTPMKRSHSGGPRVSGAFAGLLPGLPMKRSISGGPRVSGAFTGRMRSHEASRLSIIAGIETMTYGTVLPVELSELSL